MSPSQDKPQLKMQSDKPISPIVPPPSSAGKQAFAAVMVALIFFGGGFGAARLIAMKNAGNSAITKKSAAQNLAGASAPLLLDNTRILNPDIIVLDQAQGATVAVTQVKNDTDAWIAIHEDDEGEPGRILGAQRFRSGTESGAVDLLRPTVNGGVYYAVLHYDDGDDVFDHTKDIPLRDVFGKSVMTEFKATN